MRLLFISSNKQLAGIDYFYCIQRNTLDRRKRTLVIEAWNESFASRINVKEYCKYYVSFNHSSTSHTIYSNSLSLKIVFSFSKGTS